MAKSLLQQIRESHQEYLAGLEGGFKEGTEAGGARGAGRAESAGRGAAGGGGGGGEAGGGTAAAADAGGVAPSRSSLLDADALALLPLFSDSAATGGMNFLNKTGGAMSLGVDVADIASRIGQGGSLAGFLKDLGHTCCSSTGALRQAIRVREGGRGWGREGGRGALSCDLCWGLSFHLSWRGLAWHGLALLYLPCRAVPCLGSANFGFRCCSTSRNPDTSLPWLLPCGYFITNAFSARQGECFLSFV